MKNVRTTGSTIDYAVIICITVDFMYTSPECIDRHSADLVDRKTTLEKSYPHSQIFSSRSIASRRVQYLILFSASELSKLYGHNITPTDNCLPGRCEENE